MCIRDSDIDDAVDDMDGILPLARRQSGGVRGRADFHAFAATGAGIRHGVGAGFQGGFERSDQWLLRHKRQRSAESGPIEGHAKSM